MTLDIRYPSHRQRGDNALGEHTVGRDFQSRFMDLKSRADKPREIRPDYFIVTGDQIFLLNEEGNDAAAKKISALNKPPDFKANDIYGISQRQLRTAAG
jgi:hypothetical protein